MRKTIKPDSYGKYGLPHDPNWFRNAFNYTTRQYNKTCSETLFIYTEDGIEINRNIVLVQTQNEKKTVDGK